MMMARGREYPVPFYLETPTVPGTATWTFYAPGSIGPITGLMFVDATFLGAPDGSIAAPFVTIQAALDAIGDATTVAEQFEGWKVIISANFYDEDLVIPQRRSIVLDCAPGVILADGFSAVPPPPTTARKITWAQNLVPLGAIESYGLQINNLIMFDGIELISGGTAVDPTLELRLNQVTFVSGVVAGTIPSIDGTGLTVGTGVVEVRDCLLRDTGGTGFCVDAGPVAGPAGAPPGRTYISYANSCEFDAAVRALGYGQIVNCTFNSNQTYLDQTNLGNLDRPEGFFGCTFDNSVAHVWDMVVASPVIVDGITWNSLSSNWVDGGAAPLAGIIETLSDPFIAGNTAAGDATWLPAPSGGNTLSNAIERIAAAVAGLLGSPIP